MANYIYPLPVSSPYLAIGDDVYAKPLNPWDPVVWENGQVHGDPVAGQTIWNLRAGDNGLQTNKSYSVFQNSAFRPCTCNAGTDVITAVAHDLIVGTRVYFRSSNLPSGLTAGTPYWVDSITPDTFKLRANEDMSGGFVSLGSAGSSVLFVATSYRSASDQTLGTIAALDANMIGEGEADAIAAAVIAKYKADPQLGTADGGLVANAAASKAKTDAIGTLKSLLRW